MTDSRSSRDARGDGDPAREHHEQLGRGLVLGEDAGRPGGTSRARLGPGAAPAAPGAVRRRGRFCRALARAESVRARAMLPSSRRPRRTTLIRVNRAAGRGRTAADGRGVFVEGVRLFVVLLGTAAGFWVGTRSRQRGAERARRWSAASPATWAAGCSAGSSIGRSAWSSGAVDDMPPAQVVAGILGAVAGACMGVDPRAARSRSCCRRRRSSRSPVCSRGSRAGSASASSAARA